MRALTALLWLALAWALLRALRYSGALLDFPYQVDWREGAPLRSALAIAQGRNPWDPAWVAQDGSVYGPGFPWLAAICLPTRGLTLAGLRLFSLALLGLASLGLGAVARRLGGSRLSAAAAAILVFGGLLFSVTPLGRGDALAVAGLLGPLLLLAWGPARWPRLLAAAALGALGVLAKSYAGYALVWVLVYLGVQRRWREAAFFALAWALCLLAAAAAFQRLYPGCLVATTACLATGPWLSWAWLAHQDAVYLTRAAWPLLPALAASLWLRRSDRGAWAWLAVLVATLAVLELLLGRNKGAILTYYFQFLHPVAALALVASAVPRGGQRHEPPWLPAALVLATLLTVSTATEPLERLQAVDLRPWRAVDAWVAAARRPLLPQLFCSMATTHGKPVHDNGHTQLLDLVPDPVMRGAFQAQQARWQVDLDAGAVDLVILKREPGQPARTLKGYRRQGLFCLETPANVWEHVACFDVYHPGR